MSRSRSGRLAFTVVGLVAAALVALLVPGDAHPVRQGADAGFTYGYLPSVVTRGDLDFTDDSLPFDSIMPHTVEGRTPNSFPIGPAVWWSPAFVAAHAVGAVARVSRHASTPAPDGRSWPYDALVGWAALAVGVVGLWATLALAGVFASRAAAAVGTAALWLAGPLVYYTTVNVIQAHVAGFAASALLLLAWVRLRQREEPALVAVLGLGLLGGLTALTRWQNGLLLLGPALDGLSGRLRGRRAPDLGAGAVLAGGALVAFTPQLVVWNALYGSPFRPPRGEAAGAFLDFSRLHLGDVVFSWRHGMLSWHPVLVAGVVGLVLLLRRRPLVAGSLLVVLAVTWVVNAAAFDWWAGVSFGARRFDGLWPALAVGVAVVADRVPRGLAVAVPLGLATVNWLLLNAFAGGLVSGDGPVHPTTLWRVLDRVPLAPAVDNWSAHKAAWVIGLVVLSLLPLVVRLRATAPLHRVRRRSWKPWARPALAGLAGALAVSTVVAGAAAATPRPFDPHVFEAGYFVSQPRRPARTDRVVSPGQVVWTGVFTIPGFLPAGRYVASVSGVRSVGAGPARLVVRLDGKRIVSGDAGAAGRRTLRGAPFTARRGFLRLDLDVTGGPVHLDAVRLDRRPG